MNDLTINEIFFSIQGESQFTGLPCIFVRLTHCNLRCTWCDTEYAFYEGKEMSFDEVFAEISKYDCKLVEITGGEPLAQEDVHPFMTLLCDRGFKVLLETGGSINIANVDPRVTIIMDIKCPGSGMEKKNLMGNIGLLQSKDEVKFVIRDKEDFDWSVDIIRRHGLDTRCPVLMSPVFNELEPIRLSEWILGSGITIRFQLQVHKFIWEPETRGV